MSLPSVAGVQSRIHTLPGRPPFMTVYDLADFYEATPYQIMKQVRRNIGRFPEGFIIELNEDEIATLVGQNGLPNRINRGAVIVFTEMGALQLSSVLTGPVADAVSVIIIRAFVLMHSQQQSDMTAALWKFRMTWLEQKKMRTSIAQAVTDGKDWAAVRDMHRSIPHWALVQEIRDSLFFGTIATPPKGTPMHLRQPEPKAPVVTPETDPRQLSMLEG